MNGGFKSYEGEAPYIFISYAHKDNQQALPLLEAISRAGYRLWYDSDIRFGKQWADSLARHIGKCAVFMPLLSPAFANSPDCYDETMYARSKKKAIVPVCLQEVELPPGLEMTLHPVQWLRLSDYRDAEAFALTLDMEPACAPCKETRSQEAAS